MIWAVCNKCGGGEGEPLDPKHPERGIRHEGCDYLGGTVSEKCKCEPDAPTGVIVVGDCPLHGWHAVSDKAEGCEWSNLEIPHDKGEYPDTCVVCRAYRAGQAVARRKALATIEHLIWLIEVEHKLEGGHIVADAKRFLEADNE